MRRAAVALKDAPHTVALRPPAMPIVATKRAGRGPSRGMAQLGRPSNAGGRQGGDGSRIPQNKLSSLLIMLRNVQTLRNKVYLSPQDHGPVIEELRLLEEAKYFALIHSLALSPSF